VLPEEKLTEDARMRIEVLYFQGCPNHAPTVTLVSQVLAQLGVHAPVREVEVLTSDDAHRLRFLGSPSVRVNGMDIESEARHRTDFALSCRMYDGVGVPPRRLVEAAIKGALASGVDDCCGVPTALADDPSPQQAGLLTVGGSVLSAAAASACCWLPLLLAAFGFSAAGVSTVFTTVRPYFVTLAGVLLAVGFYIVYARKTDCAPGSPCGTANAPNQRRNRAMLWVATVAVLLFAFFPSYVGVFAKSGTNESSVLATSDGYTLVLDIRGMTCPACATHIQHALAEVPGVRSAFVSYEKPEARVLLSSAEPSITERLVAVVSEAGFAAVPRHAE
jgi:copper chaperone CopZ